MATLAQYLTADRVHSRVALSSKKRILEMISELLVQNVSGISSDTLFEQMLKREKLGSTAIGQGVAIPHSRTDAIDTPIIAVITIDQPIAYDTPDQKPVDLFVGMLVPNSDPDAHLQLLSQLAHLLTETELAEQLRSAEDNPSLYNAMLIGTVVNNEGNDIA